MRLTGCTRVYVKYLESHPNSEDMMCNGLVSLSLHFPGISEEELEKENITFHMHDHNGLICGHRYFYHVVIDDFWIDPTKKYVRVKVTDEDVHIGSNFHVYVECCDIYGDDSENENGWWKCYKMKTLLYDKLIKLDDDLSE